VKRHNNCAHNKIIPIVGRCATEADLVEVGVVEKLRGGAKPRPHKVDGAGAGDEIKTLHVASVHSAIKRKIINI